VSGNTEIPGRVINLFDGLDGRAGPRAVVAAAVGADVCRRLYQGGVRDFHFYTLNRADQTYAICHLLGLRAKPGTEPKS
jgi:methylenetetrahydrofolate reductase (NADPH)